jgi:hypothetical protein
MSILTLLSNYNYYFTNEGIIFFGAPLKAPTNSAASVSLPRYIKTLGNPAPLHLRLATSPTDLEDGSTKN